MILTHVAIRFQLRPEPGLAFSLPPVAMLNKEPEMLQADVFREHKMQQNATEIDLDPCGRAYSAPPALLAGFMRATSLWGEGGKWRKWVGTEGEGEMERVC